jgi:hypothetical protein
LLILNNKQATRQATDKQPDKRPTSDRQATDKRTTMSHASCDNHASSNSHAIANVECTGVFSQQIREMQPYHNAPNYMSCRGDYHLFAKHGDKVYIEVRNAGEIVISFAELQKNKYLKYYYNMSVLLANDKHRLRKNEDFNKTYNQIYGYTASRVYTGDRVWSLETAYIDQSDLKNFKIIPSGIVCYYKINPFDLEKMEYSTRQELERFELGYMNELVRVKYFVHIMEERFKNIALEYQIARMEKELEELSVYFENKKHILNLTTLNSKYCMNDDILTKIYNMVSIGGKYEYLVQTEESYALIFAE